MEYTSIRTRIRKLCSNWVWAEFEPNSNKIRTQLKLDLNSIRIQFELKSNSIQTLLSKVSNCTFFNDFYLLRWLEKMKFLSKFLKRKRPEHNNHCHGLELDVLGTRDHWPEILKCSQQQKQFSDGSGIIPKIQIFGSLLKLFEAQM